MWNDLTMSERADVIKMAVKAGLRDMKSIRDFYDDSLKYANGGPKATYGKPYYSYDKNMQIETDNGKPILNYSATLPEVNIIPDSKKSPADRNEARRFREKVFSDNAEREVRDYTQRQIMKSQRDWDNSLEKKALGYAQDAMTGVGIGADIVSGYPVYSSLKGSRVLSEANSLPEYIEGGLWLAPIGGVVGKEVYNVGKNTIKNTIASYDLYNNIKNGKINKINIPSKILYRANVYRGGKIKYPKYSFFTTDEKYASQYGKVNPYIFESKNIAVAKEPLMGNADPVNRDIMIYHNLKDNPSANAIIGYDKITGEFPYQSRGAEILNLDSNNIFPIKVNNLKTINFNSIGKSVNKKVSKEISEQLPVTQWTPEQWTAAQDAAIARGDMAEAQRLRDLHFQVSAPNSHISKGVYLPSGSQPTLSQADYYNGNNDLVTLYHSSVDADNLIKEGFDGVEHGLGRTKGEAKGTIFASANPDYAADYSNLYIQEGLSTPDKVGLIELKVPRGAGTYEGSEVRLRPEHIKQITKSAYEKTPWLKWLKTRKTDNSLFNIKSADAVTYDDNGIRIPLGLRDNFKSKDIRYGIIPLIGGTALSTNKKAEGGSIHISPSKRGTFTAAATKHGMGVQEFASKVLANKDNYSSAMIKKANFAKNASKWKHGLGGYLLELGGPKSTNREYKSANSLNPTNVSKMVAPILEPVSKYIMDIGDKWAMSQGSETGIENIGKDDGSNSIAQDTYLLPRSVQRAVFESKGYEYRPQDYGLVKKAVNGRNIPVYQRAPDDITRDKVVPLGNSMAYSDDQLIQGWFGKKEALLEDPTNFPTTFYISTDGKKLYQKGWDLNDYGDSAETYYDGDTRQLAAKAIDLVGSPTVVTTGISEVGSINDLMAKENKHYIFNIGLIRDLFAKKGLVPLQVGNDYVPSLPEVTIIGKRRKKVK